MIYVISIGYWITAWTSMALAVVIIWSAIVIGCAKLDENSEP